MDKAVKEIEKAITKAKKAEETASNKKAEANLGKAFSEFTSETYIEKVATAGDGYAAGDYKFKKVNKKDADGNPVNGADGNPVKEYPEALQAEIRKHVKNQNDGVLDDYYLAADGKTILAKVGNTELTMDKAVKEIEKAITAFHKGDYDE